MYDDDIQERTAPPQKLYSMNAFSVKTYSGPLPLCFFRNE